MDFITPSLALGDVEDAGNRERLSAAGIGAILSLVPVACSAAVSAHLALEVEDRAALPEGVLRRAIDFLDIQVAAGRRVLLHCGMGISRSPAVAVAYLHHTQGLGLDEALHRVRAIRPAAAPHPALLASICAHFGQASPIVAAPGAETIDLSANESPYGPGPAVRALIATGVETLHRYPDKEGAALKAALAEKLSVPSGQIVLGAGASELLELAARAFLGPGDEALIPYPSFPPYRAAVERARAVPTLVPLADGRVDLDRLSEQCGPRTRLVILGNPNNPTGGTLASQELDAFFSRLPAGVVVVLDEAYREYVDQADFADGLAHVRAGRPAVVLRSFSKAYGLAALRIGYGIAPLPLARRLAAQARHYNTGSLAQAAALAALQDTRHLARSVQTNAEGRDWLARALQTLGVASLPSQGNFLLVFVRDGAAVARALAEQGIRVKSGDSFGLPDCIRVTVGLPHENHAFVAALADIANSNNTDQTERRISW